MFPFTDESEVTTIVVVTEVVASRDLEFDEAKEEVASSFIRDESRRLAEERAETIASQAREANGNLRRFATRYGLRTRNSDFVTGSDNIPDLGSAGILGAEAFRAEPGTIEGPLRAGADWVVYRVQARLEADMSGFEEEREFRIIVSPMTQALRNLFEKENANDPNEKRKLKEIKYRKLGKRQIPYIELLNCSKKKSLPIKQIIIGPHEDQPSLEEEVKGMTGGLDIAVHCCETPYVRKR